MTEKNNKIKFISLPKQLDVDNAISDKIKEVYGVCPYCGQSDEIQCCSYTDYMHMVMNFHASPTFEYSVSREFFSKIKRSDFELEELQLNGKAPFFKTKRTKLYDWVRMLFYCPDCDCLWGSGKYPINLSSDTSVIQHIMEMHTQGYDSTALISLQNGFPTDLPNTRIPYPDPKSISECPSENLDTTDSTNNIKSQELSPSTIQLENDLGIILSTVLNEFSSPACWDDSNKKAIVERNSKYKSYEIANNITLIQAEMAGDRFKVKFKGYIDTFRYNASYDMVSNTYDVYIEETEYHGGIYKESIPRDELDEWKSSDWHLNCQTIPITSRYLKYEKYKNVMY